MNRLLGFVVSFLLLASSTYAQFQTAEVLGTVRDPSNAPVANVKVTLTSEQTGIERKTVSDASGNYDFFNTPVGRYTVAAETPSFSRFVTNDVAVDVNARQRVDINLQVGKFTQSVDVQGVAERGCKKDCVNAVLERTKIGEPNGNQERVDRRVNRQQ